MTFQKKAQLRNRQYIINKLLIMTETNKILAILDNYLQDNPDEIAKEIAAEFRRRRIREEYKVIKMTEKWAFFLSVHHNFNEIIVLLETILSQE